MESVLIQSNIDDRPNDHIEHLKCGEVFTWQCAGESYAVECKLCDDHPLCPLSEFPQHMEIWHTDWQQDLEIDKEPNEDLHNTDDDDEEDQFFNYEDHNDDQALSFTTEDSGCLFESDDNFQQNERVLNVDPINNKEEILEPFEQVLIEQENNNCPNEDSIQIREDLNAAEECLNEVNKQVAEVLAAVTESEQRSNFNINKTLNERKCKQKDLANELAEKERDYGNLPKITESKRELNVKETNVAKENDNVEKVTNKFKNSRRILKNIKEIEENLEELSGNETSEEKYQEFTINEINLGENETEITKFESETNENETDVLKNLQKLQNSLKICKRTRKSKRNVKENKESTNELKEIKETAIGISENETNELGNIEIIESKRNLKENVTKIKNVKKISRKSKKPIENDAGISENETIVIENFKTNRKTKKSLRNFTENLINRKDLKENYKELRKLRDYETETIENETVTSENETEKSENGKIKKCIRNFKENIRKSRALEELKEKLIETSENETAIKNEGNNKNSQKNFKENSIKSKDFKENVRKLTNSHKLIENETETSEIETVISENDTITSENESETSTKANDLKYSTNSNKLTFFDNSFKNTQDNFKNIRNFSINLRKNLKYLQELQEKKAKPRRNHKKFEEIGHSTRYKRKLIGNQEKLRKEERHELKQVESISRDRNEREFLQKFTKLDKITQNVTQKSCKTRSSKRNLRNCSREFSEEEQGERGLRDLYKKVIKLQESFENYTKSSRFPKTNVTRTRKSKMKLNHEQLFTQSDLSIEESSSDCSRETKRKLQNYESELEELDLSSFEALKQTKEPLKKPTRHGYRSSKRRLTTLNEDLTPNKRTRRESSSETSDISEEISSNNSVKEGVNKTAKQTLVTQFFKNENVKTKVSVSPTSMDITDTCSLNSFNSSPDYASSKDNSSPTPLSPFSPKTEDEHFEFCGPKREQLNKHHIEHLIKLYQEHPRLWEQAHPEFCEPELCRKSWQQITDQWNAICQRKFTTAEVRIRLGTLCQRYVQERERLALEGELDEFTKFPHYEQMQFLEQQESLQKRTELLEQQNEKILKIYQLFPLLWHINSYKVRQSKERAEAFENISQSLKLSGLHLSSQAVQKRIRSLRKCYRLEKIRFLNAQVEQTPFESNFCHYERMKFLHQHIEPFRCRICGRIFENLSRFREHLEEENHGDVLQEDCESEREDDEKEKDKIVKNLGDILESENSPASLELEISSDVLQTFTPLSTSPLPNEEPVTTVNLDTAPTIQEVIIFPPPTPAASFVDSLNLENQLMEEIMENVSNESSFSQKSLDQYINSVTNSEELSSNGDNIEETISSEVMDIAIEDLSDNNIIIMEPIASDIFEVGNPIVCNETLKVKDQSFEVSSTVTNAEEMLSGSQEIQLESTETSSLPSPLVVNVPCNDFSLDLNLNSPPYEILNPNSNDSDNELHSSGDISTLPLPDQEIRKMIALYRKYPQIWNPNHLDYNSRNLRRQAWCQLTKEFSVAVGKQFSWRTLHRKLTDYAKYYKKLITEQENYEELENKWAFYEDFKFLDDVLVVHDELQRSVHHRDNNFKIIKIYETLPQLWNIKHPDYSKRSSKQRLIELMCNRLQEEYNLQLTTERLKNRLIELRAQYRTAKKQRLKCEKNQQTFTTDLEFYEAFKFLDPHIDPFICEKCGKEFKKLTDYNQHIKREHEKSIKEKPAPLTLLPLEPGVDKNLQNICHICGIKFSTRSNLVHHVRRHEGVRNYECPMCPKKFFASHPLKVHIRSHTKECPYTCEKCGMSFVSASKLNQHVKRHLDRKDYQCDYCPKRFFTGFEKNRHERRHLNIRDKVCPICGKTFVVGSSYYAHMMLHNDTKRFECGICKMKFAQYAGLYKHKKKYHPT
ncbi:kinesin-related protein 4-like [Lucilia sericata]|uniref:kinesin-related protein 4-like n=1 Tax=Lucilia sericata TaxID=13632 RepID=UPI0018A829CA|nr:kinesin-related protein 4-like [Lucilia sericata]XP_037814391.1 kinesin-related protein 4-like [Lucilia sericata]XP_037814392.1 kinesin-related protein 4-like [Lucilia sericata]XP_037814393.1 kinesin-related protein 4-like [Lucilia sericata]XP_037814394.1 kinesin-related protein 4-like [Lucilia sericata]